jgi:dihydroorotate dehydrogenase
MASVPPAVIGFLDGLTRPIMRVLAPETAHRLAVNGLRVLPLSRPAADDPRLGVNAFGLTFPNPVGLAAGFDKNGEAAGAVLGLGFGFTEVGTVTPRPQGGNPRPRLFRLDADEAVINRLGFNSQGGEAVLNRLAASLPRGIVGINIGANKETPDRVADYVALIATLAPVASYFTVNISSPNTPGLRDLQQANALDDLLARVKEARARASRGAKPIPLLVKIAPDLSLGDLDDVVGIARARRIDGMIVGNTTIMRPASLRDPARAMEQGGLSGRPLFRLATRMLAETYVRVEGQFPLVGAGGIDSGAAAFAKVKAGATLVQLYTGLVFRGLKLVSAIKADLVSFLRLGRYDSLADAVGRDAAAVTAEPWPE